MSNENGILNLLSNLISIITVNDPFRNIRPSRNAVDRIKALIDEALDLDSKLFENNGYYTIYNVVGSGKPIVLFLAHYDTVPVNISEWIYDPFKLTVKGSKAYDRGAADDKGNIVAIVYALREVLKEKFCGTIIYAFTGDEEIGGRNGTLAFRHLLEKKGLLPDFVVNGDGSGLIPIVRRRNTFIITISVPEEKIIVKGRRVGGMFKVRICAKETRHSAYFMPGVDSHPLLALSEYLRYKRNLFLINLSGSWVKSNVIPSRVTFNAVKKGSGNEYEVDVSLTKLIRSLIIISRMNVKTELDSDYGVTINPNIYVYKDGVHTIKIDVRAMSKKLPNTVHERIKSIFSNIGLTKVDIKIKDGSGYLYTEEDSYLVRQALDVQKMLSLEEAVCELAGASDSRFFSPLGIQCIDYGPTGGNVHGPNEYVNIKSLVKAKNFYAKLAQKILK